MSAEKPMRTMLLALMAALHQHQPTFLAEKLRQWGFDPDDVSFHVASSGRRWTAVHRWPWEPRLHRSRAPGDGIDGGTALDAEGIRALIVARVLRVRGDMSAACEAKIRGEVRGLIAVLLGGREPPDSEDVPDSLVAAQIPHVVRGDGFEIADDWLLAHGFVRQEDGSYVLPGGWAT